MADTDNHTIKDIPYNDFGAPVSLGAGFFYPYAVAVEGHWDDSLAVNAPGQFGDPSSRHYRDLFAPWLEGKYFPLVYSRAAVEKVTERKITLESRE